jgi:hypothetical protein
MARLNGNEPTTCELCDVSMKGNKLGQHLYIEHREAWLPFGFTRRADLLRSQMRNCSDGGNRPMRR